MIRICVLVEGQTEQAFVGSILRPHLYKPDIQMYATLMGKRGGNCRYQAVRKDILNSLKAGQICTTMVDFYGMPGDWPGRIEAGQCRSYSEKARKVEESLHADIVQELGNSFNPDQFIPYVQMHEFEALLFSDPSVFAKSLGESSLESQFQAILDQFSFPEEINDNYETCPSRRIKNLASKYEKVVDGVTILRKIGLEKVRQTCPNFDRWITKLESLKSQS